LHISHRSIFIFFILAIQEQWLICISKVGNPFFTTMLRTFETLMAKTELTELVNIIDSREKPHGFPLTAMLHYTHDKLSALVNLVQEKHHSLFYLCLQIICQVTE
ncbi:hypothetical protein ACJX0J_039576, partial [Zea mays]